mmetsp:Transcript_64437/g.153748  ORF Transcript_64437/g.153748 Transcript_64437/m.153748 type:complete len:563 (+) Transcript_64437:2-1690(+)
MVLREPGSSSNCCIDQLNSSFVMLRSPWVVSPLLVLVQVQAQHHSWGWFYENMCGCALTQHEGCGMSAQQLYKDLTDSPSLRMCELTNSQGNATLTENYQDPNEVGLIERTVKECTARRELKEIAEQFKKCMELGSDKAACEHHSDFCEFDAQDKGRCGIDEEKLVVKFVGKQYEEHPLIKNVLLEDRCSTKAFDKCMEEKTCQWNVNHKRCMANQAILFSSMVEHPALFEVLEIQQQGSRCQSWSDFVWEGKTCWRGACKWERGICVSNHEQDHKPNITSVMAMKNQMCHGHYGGGNSVAGGLRVCPEGCYMDAKNGYCMAEKIEVSDPESLELTPEDKHVALYFKVLRSVTVIQEIRCNSLDDDLEQCKRVDEEYNECPEGYYHPYDSWHQRGGGGRGSSSPAPAPTQDEDDSDVKNAMDHIAEPDGGVGFQGQLGDLVKLAQTNGDALVSNFSGFISDPKTEDLVRDIAKQTPDAVKGLRTMLAETEPDVPAPPKTEESKAVDSNSSAFMMCVVSLILAAVCGGFAWGVLCTNKMGGRERSPALLETQYMRHQEPGAHA